MHNYERYRLIKERFDLKTKLIIVNVIVFGIILLIPNIANVFAIYSPFSEYFIPIQLFTHQYLHANLSHLFFNMLGLWFLMSGLEQYMDNKKLFIFYTLCGVLSALGSSIATHFLSPGFDSIPSVGASGAIFGLFGANYVYNKEQKVLLFFILPVRLKYIFLIYMGIELYSGLFGGNDGVGHFAHFFGGLFGILLVKLKK